MPTFNYFSSTESAVSVLSIRLIALPALRRIAPATVGPSAITYIYVATVVRR